MHVQWATVMSLAYHTFIRMVNTPIVPYNTSLVWYVDFNLNNYVLYHILQCTIIIVAIYML